MSLNVDNSKRSQRCVGLEIEAGPNGRRIPQMMSKVEEAKFQLLKVIKERNLHSKRSRTAVIQVLEM